MDDFARYLAVLDEAFARLTAESPSPMNIVLAAKDIQFASNGLARIRSDMRRWAEEYLREPPREQPDDRQLEFDFDS